MATFTFALDAPMPAPCAGGVLTIGNFDGVHVGHQSLLAEAARQARLLGVSAVAATFDPHPIQLLRPERVEPFLTTLEDRAALMQGFGADHVLIVQTTPALLQLTAREFFERIVVGALKTRAMVEGFNFGFGKNREGSIDVLQTLCREKGIGLTIVPPFEVNGQRVSSSRVRHELLAGDAAAVRELLGRPYRLTGIVGAGQKRGATLGFPTANLLQIPTLVPGNGVYAVRVFGVGPNHDGWPAAANIGPNPTFGEHARKIEVHLLDFAGDLYDRSLTVEFIAKLRDTRPFGNPQDLVDQLHKDVAAARRILCMKQGSSG